MQKEEGVYIVPCVVNGLKLKFIFDTGASIVAISMTEALFMLKDGYLNSSDILGKSYLQDATGTISEGTRIIIRSIEIANHTIYNVEAIVTHEMSAPLLLGQSAMGKFGKFQFDPTTGDLLIFGFNETSVSPAYNKQPDSPKPFIPFDYNSLPLYSGKVEVFVNSQIYKVPDRVNSKQVGKATKGIVQIIRKENLMFYYVKANSRKGFLWVGDILDSRNRH
ncbi:MAG: retropepsin-like aspartic protease [Saprospiraceae bacterium]